MLSSYFPKYIVIKTCSQCFIFDIGGNARGWGVRRAWNPLKKLRPSAGNNRQSTIIDCQDLKHNCPKSFHYDQYDHRLFPCFKNKVFVEFRFYTIQWNWLICIAKFVHIPIHASRCRSNMTNKYFCALSYYNKII